MRTFFSATSSEESRSAEMDVVREVRAARVVERCVESVERDMESESIVGGEESPVAEVEVMAFAGERGSLKTESSSPI